MGWCSQNRPRRCWGILKADEIISQFFSQPSPLYVKPSVSGIEQRQRDQQQQQRRQHFILYLYSYNNSNYSEEGKKGLSTCYLE